VIDPIARADNRRFIGAPERGERIGGDTGRLLGPGVILSESFFLGCRSSQIARARSDSGRAAE
jgi:hypothetical protein